MENKKRQDKIDARKILEIYIAFFKLGAISFGGGYAMVSLIEQEMVDVKHWIDPEKVVDVFAVAGSLPGAIGLNASALVGYNIAGFTGAIAAIAGNLSPSVGIVLILSILFAEVGSYPEVKAAFNGLRPAIIALIAFSAYKIGRTAIKDFYCFMIFITAFYGMMFTQVNPIFFILLGAFAGIGGEYLKTFVSRKEI
ncbi:chromate transporter [Sporomusa aerivorans]|uniref:chromate transporter n=1 Tax=Sporomusa aerivorans TaxID=204936 RepID=UPI00352B2B8A